VKTVAIFEPVLRRPCFNFSIQLFRASEVYKLDSVFNQARELASYWMQDLPLDAGEQLITRLRAVTADQVKSVAARYFGDDQLTVAVLLPQPLDKSTKPRTPAAGARH